MEKKGNILMKKYEVGRLLGKGNFAKVYYGRNLETGQGVAIKVIDKEKVLRVGLMNQTKREISVMGMIKHQNVVQLYEVLATKTKIHFAMEHVKGGELFQRVSKGRLDENEARKYFQQLISAVSFCHERGVYHRDLKPENLLLDEFGNLKVTDFGLSALSESKRQDGLLHTACGTPAYVAPEVISRKGYDGAKADVWSCGVILYVLLAGYLPFYDSNVMEMYKKISKAQFKFPNWFPTDAKRLLSRILDPNPKTRISIARIMNHHWFKKGLNLKDSLPKAEDNTENPHIDIDHCLKPLDTSDGPKSYLSKPTNLNAFDIISLSSGLDLSGLFISSDRKDEVQFTSTKSTSDIVSKLEDIASILRLKVMKKDEGSMRLERSNECRNGDLWVDVSVYQIAASYRLVELRKSSGDSFEYQRLMRELRPEIKDVVWAWQGEQERV